MSDGIDLVLDVTRPGHPEGRVHVVRNGAVLARGVRAPGPLVVGRGARVHGSVHARGFVHLAAGALVAGDVHAYGDVVVGAGATIVGVLRAEGSVTLLHDANVVGGIDAAHDVTVRRGARCGSLACGGDLWLDEPGRLGEVRAGGRTAALAPAASPVPGAP